MLIKSRFDPSKDIYRTIEKVITYGAAADRREVRLRAEIAEYIVTDSMEAQFEELLRKMQLSTPALRAGASVDQGGQNEVGVWVSGFYGSGKSSFTKYLGLALDDAVQVDGVRFLRHLQGDGRYDDFTARIQSELGVLWSSIQNDPLVIDSVLPDIAHDLYPELFRTAAAFSTETAEYVRTQRNQVEEMLAIVRSRSGKQHVLFVVDEVGQHVSERKHLILNLQGLAENLKIIGDGKAWIVATAQQTLTEDDPRAALNSPELYKLKDRFPIQIDLESSDIREICRRRLLGKSAEGERALGELFERHDQALRHNTRLQDARYYDSDFDRQTFTDLYPFLPAHFDILLHLLGALAKSTGGIGLRSAIDAAINALSRDPFTPFGEKEGNLCFFSKKINDIDQERAQLPLRGIELRHIQNEALRELWSPLPSTRLHGTLAVTSGLGAALGGLSAPMALAGERETIQTVVELVEAADYEMARSRLVDESRQRSAASAIFLLGRAAAEIDERVAEIYRCREIVQRYRNDPDQEVKDYCIAQSDRAGRLSGEVQRQLSRSLSQGSFIFRGQATAVDSLNADLLEAARAHLAGLDEIDVTFEVTSDR